MATALLLAPGLLITQRGNVKDLSIGTANCLDEGRPHPIEEAKGVFACCIAL